MKKFFTLILTILILGAVIPFCFSVLNLVDDTPQTEFEQDSIDYIILDNNEIVF